MVRKSGPGVIVRYGNALLSAPTVSPDGKKFNNSIQVTMSTVTGGTQIRYTLDGTDPTSSSTLYSGTVTLSKTTTVKAATFKSGSTTSPITTQTYTLLVGEIVLEAETMSFNGYQVDNGTHSGGQFIMVDPTKNSGTVTASFSGENDTYDVQLYVRLEHDGAPTIKFYTNNVLLINEKYPIDPASFNLSVAKVYEVKGIQINKGQQIKIEGTPDGGAFARVDKIRFISTTQVSVSDHRIKMPEKLVILTSNPSRDIVEFNFQKITQGNIILSIYDNAGNLITSASILSGTKTYFWDGTESQGIKVAGIYLYSITGEGFATSGKIVKVK